jgi:suppressor for copper-sensitivity B
MDRSGQTMALVKTLTALAALLCCATAAVAQKGGLGLGDGLGLDLPGFGDEKASASVTATLAEDTAKPGEAILSIRITTTGKSNTYGVDSTSPYKTKLELKPNPALVPTGALTADREPKISFDENFQKKVGKYQGEVTFQQRLTIAAGTTGTVTAAGKVDFLFCDEQNCIPRKESFTASFERSAQAAAAAPAASAKAAAEVPAPVDDVPPPVEDVAAAAKPAAQTGPLAFGYRTTPSYLKMESTPPFTAEMSLEPAAAKAGETVTLTVALTMRKGWHTYSIREGENVFGSPTTFEFTEMTGLESIGGIQESPEPHVKKVDKEEAYTFHDQVTWTQAFRRVGNEPVGLVGKFKVGVCEGQQCLAPKTMNFSFGSLQDPKHLVRAVPIGSTTTPTGVAGHDDDAIEAASIDFRGAQFEIEEDTQSTTLWSALAFAFVGGLTLNIMPCVLPVLAIKILSIVQQAGESRGRILLMNIAYTFGVVSIFALLATLAAFFSVGWGEQFQKEWFRVATVLIVFVCGLNLLGVFEILLPGMLSQAASGGEHREGYFGAFMTGIFATLLATPCSTGYMTYALAWSVKQTTPVIYLVWCTMGLGMALPYLLIGIYPKLIKWLPRPGMWMVHFKQASAFAMFGAAVWFLMSVDQRNVLPVLVACVGLGLGLWMVGHLYDRESPLSRKSLVRISSIAATTLICTIAYRMHTAATAPPPDSELPWVAFNQEKLIELRKAGKPVLIDFTADWCAICKQNEHVALNTINTADFVRKNGITTMVADYTNQSDDIRRWLSHFKSISVPLTVVVPPDPNAKIIRLAGPFSEGKLLETLERAMQRKTSSPAGETVVADSSGKMVMTKEN